MPVLTGSNDARTGRGRGYRARMSKRAATPRTPPVPFGSEGFVGMSHDEVVACLGVPYLSRAALWHLVLVGPEAAPAVRAGLSDPNPLIRGSCCELVEHWPDPEALPQLEAL